MQRCVRIASDRRRLAGPSLILSAEKLVDAKLRLHGDKLVPCFRTGELAVWSN